MAVCRAMPPRRSSSPAAAWMPRSEEHTSELQSQSNLVCRLLLEKKKNYLRLLDYHKAVQNHHKANQQQPRPTRNKPSFKLTTVIQGRRGTSFHRLLLPETVPYRH